jgi:hypothetical protein
MKLAPSPSSLLARSSRQKIYLSFRFRVMSGFIVNIYQSPFVYSWIRPGTDGRVVMAQGLGPAVMLPSLSKPIPCFERFASSNLALFMKMGLSFFSPPQESPDYFPCSFCLERYTYTILRVGRSYFDRKRSGGGGDRQIFFKVQPWR